MNNNKLNGEVCKICAFVHENKRMKVNTEKH